ELLGQARQGKFLRAVVHARSLSRAPFVHPFTAGELERSGRAPLEQDPSRRRPVGALAEGKARQAPSFPEREFPLRASVAARWNSAPRPAAGQSRTSFDRRSLAPRSERSGSRAPS